MTPPVLQSSDTATTTTATTTTTTQPHFRIPKGPLVISGPSGTGKSTLLSRLFAAHPTTFGFSVSHTTRRPRPGEVDGQHYHFVSRDRFLELKATPGFFVETAEFGGNLYGTSFGAVEDVAEGRGRKKVMVGKGQCEDEKGEKEGMGQGEGRCCVLDIEMEGVKQIHASPLNHARFLFLSPPSLGELERRLRSRATDDDASVSARLDQARREMDYARLPGSHDAVIVNEDLDTAYQEMERWVFAGY